MTNKEALNLLKNRLHCLNDQKCDRHCSTCKYDFYEDEVEEAEQLAIKALKKQIPKKPSVIDTGYDRFHNENTFGIFCGKCGAQITTFSDSDLDNSCTGYPEEDFYNHSAFDIKAYKKHTAYCGRCGTPIKWRGVK